MGKFLEQFLDVSRHGDINSTIPVVPIDGKSTVVRPFPICCDCVFLLEGI